MIYKVDDIDRIIPYTQMKLDCFQNLLITILVYYSLEIDYLGATWPWLFEVDYLNEDAIVVNKVICNESKLKTLYNLTLVKKDFNETITTDIYEIIKEKPIIINIDQYYVPHHYAHIFKRQHGRHSLLLLGACKESGVFCLDTMPKYKGYIDEENLIYGIKSFPYRFGYMKYCWLEGETVTRDINQEYLFEYFSELLSAAYIINNSETNKLDLGLKNILDIINDLDEGNEIELNRRLSNLLQGTWTWEINRSSHWLIRYLNTDLVIQKLGNNIGCLTEYIANVNSRVAISFRVLYKYLITKNIDDFKKGKTMLKDSQKMENILMLDLMKHFKK